MVFFGLVFFLIAVGGIISLAAVIESSHKRSAPRIGFTMFCAGISCLFLTFGLAAFGTSTGRGAQYGSFGYVLGLLGGALFGWWLGGRHKRHLIKTPTAADECRK